MNSFRLGVMQGLPDIEAWRSKFLSLVTFQAAVFTLRFFGLVGLEDIPMSSLGIYSLAASF
jgi:hypothetical protein